MGVQKTVEFLPLVLLAGLSFILPACENKNPPVAPLVALVNTPVPCAGVLGHNVIEATTGGPNDLWFIPAVPIANTTLTSLSVYTASANPITFEAGVYSDYLVSPNTLLAETGMKNSGPVTQWQQAALQHPVALSAGVTYWLAFQSTTFWYVGSAGVSYAYQSAGAYGTLPGTFSGTVGSGYVLSIYGTTCP